MPSKLIGWTLALAGITYVTGRVLAGLMGLP